MKLKSFAAIELPNYREKAFSDFLLGLDCEVLEKSARPGAGKFLKSPLQESLKKAHGAYFWGSYYDGLLYYAHALSEDRQNIDARIGQIRILVDVGRHEAAVFWADESLKDPRAPDLLLGAKAFALAYAGRVDDAKRIINVPVGAGETSMLWLFRGEVFLRIRLNILQRLFTPHKGIGKMGAFFCFLKALSPSPGDAFLNQRIGLAYMQAGDGRRGFEHLKAALNAVPGNPLTLYGLAECSRMKGDNEHALYYVKKAIAGNPGLDCAFQLLQWLHRPRLRLIRKSRREKRKEEI
jgi:tetratricopeptide (TPR) repeat protein